MKLYEEMRGLKEQQKEEITRLYLENKDLASNNVALKQLLEQKEVDPIMQLPAIISYSCSLLPSVTVTVTVG